MKNRTMFARLGAIALAAGLTFPALAANNGEIDWSKNRPVVEQQAEIPFVNYGGIRNWRAYDNRTLFIEGNGRQWYRADLMGPCIGLNFAEHIGIDSHPMNTFDRFSTVRVDGQSCAVKSVVKVDGRPTRDSVRNDTTVHQ